MKNSIKAVALSAVAMGMMSAVPASALSINLINYGNVEEGNDYYIGFKAAALYWESVILDDVTVNIRVGMANLGGTILGQASSAGTTYQADVYKDALTAAATSDADSSVVETLDNMDRATYRTYNALGKALGLYNQAGTIDSTIQFNTQFAWDFDTSDGFTGVSSDFIGVAIHEIGHALGWASGVVQSGGGTAANTDVLRYQSGEWGMNWGGDPYLSLDGGNTQIFGRSWMSTGADGRQTSHWKDGERIHDGVNCTILLEPQIGVMDPTGGSCQQAIVTAADLAVIDAIGWTLAWNILETPNYAMDSGVIRQMFFPTSTAIPEPATWAMLILGFGMVGAASRRRRTAAA